MITAYCPDSKKIDKLRKLVNQLYEFSDEIDIMVISHSPIPIDIQDKVNLYLFDEKNEILTEWDLINQPWFNPGDDRRIQSGLLTGRNTHLAIWRMIILGFSLAKNIGYKKVHQIEYDSEIANIKDLRENSRDLDKFKTIYYVDNVGTTVDEILFGSFQSYRLDYIHNDLITLNEDKIKNIIRLSSSKSPEHILQKLIHEVGDYKVKNRKEIENNGNKYATSENDKGFNPWGVPFVDLLDNHIKFIVWNQKKENGVNYHIIINDEHIFKTGLVKFNSWLMTDFGDYESINKMTIIENDVVRDIFEFKTEEDREIFKRMSFREDFKR